jgi:ribonuclease HII
MKKPTFKQEQIKMAAGYRYVAGCDEAGRGCLAGPVVAATVVLNPHKIGRRPSRWYSELRDSKLLLPKKRQKLSELIKQESLAWAVGVVPSSQIDALNIHYASLLAMEKAYNSVIKTLEKFDSYGTLEEVYLLVDGKFAVPNVVGAQEAIVAGDASVLSISAASILAKTHRDRLMVKLHKKFPAYSFDRHKGYATVAHRQALLEHGLSSVHRLSFCGNIG